MAISKIILNGVTQMDVTGKTVTSASMRNGITALKNDGTDITGSIQDMTLPSAASSTSSGTAKATITPTSSAQYLNIPEGYNDTAQFYTIAAASGGASNVVTGTFKGTTTGAAMDVNISYTGSGYPIILVIYPTEGPYNSQSGSFHGLNKRYAVATYTMIKSQATIQPNYSETGDADRANVQGSYKNSANGNSQSAFSGVGSSGKYIYNNIDASSTSSTSSLFDTVKIRSKNKMSVYIGSSYYGFAPNIEYTYYIIYSS